MIGKKFSNKIDTTNWVNRANIIVPQTKTVHEEAAHSIIMPNLIEELPDHEM
jgi:hypothetical protein